MESTDHFFKSDNLVPHTIRIISGLVFFIGTIACFTNGLIGIPIVLGAALIVTTHYGVHIDTAGKRLKRYTSLLGIKVGTWESLDRYPFITVLQINQVQRMHSLGSSTSHRSRIARVSLLSSNHRTRLKLKDFEHKEKAMELTIALAAQLPFEKTIYSPY